MKWWEKLKQNYRIMAFGVIALLALISLVIGIIAKPTAHEPHNDFKSLNKAALASTTRVSSAATAATSRKEQVRAYVDVKGAVAHPGVYPLVTDARLETVLALAGGFSNGRFKSTKLGPNS